MFSTQKTFDFFTLQSYNCSCWNNAVKKHCTDSRDVAQDSFGELTSGHITFSETRNRCHLENESSWD